ncbi:hypothetical protein FIV42_12700 [Persicimonas caeni]|uniref:Metallo-beta-lactamase domain-containing protein n=1 Tax=Persicimonas caeni TaxID=2292766 RepID=A0A4Y6PTA9_PERCE|nr:MBL fold metallo-hydrolase [Persicimonas caeni]QDG51574.1 hypothetical protein FIV42_12700 [Persicimonas caeni]QED32795.1 hypothetical protein FRD00_12695 [Persicimonas caeni]
MATWRISWLDLDHPSSNTAYRLDHEDGSLVFTGDVEIRQGCRERLVEFAAEADVLVMDAQYTNAEYPSRRGFGHSTPEDAVSVAADAGVARLFLTHHDPTHDDLMLAQMLAHARQFAGGKVQVDNARDGLEVEVGCGRPSKAARVR